MCDGSPTITDVWLVKKKFLIFYDTCECVMMIIFYIYTMRPNVWWVPNYDICVRWQKKYFLFLGDMCDHEWSSFIYIQWDLMCSGSPMITDVWLVKKIFFVSRWHVWMCDQWSSFIYIQWDQMCDGSRTMTYVWDDRKNIFDFLWHILMCGVFHSYVYNYLLSWITPSD
jgi:hypothetical protein